jgi:hypothetical protein
MVTRYLRWFVAPDARVRYLALYDLHKKEGRPQAAFLAQVGRTMAAL